LGGFCLKTLKSIHIDLDTFKILLHDTSNKDFLTIHFDKPSRKFYFSLIALIVINMQQRGKTGFVYIRKHEKILRQLDMSLAGRYASKNIGSMWEKIRKAWHYTLTDLEAAAHFKIVDRDLLPPYEKGGRYSYDCTEEECDLWASLFEIDNISNKWRFKFAVDAVKLSLTDISIAFGTHTGELAWKAFLADLEKKMNTLETEPGPISEEKNNDDPHGAHIPAHTQPLKKRFKHPWYWGFFAVVTTVLIGIMGTAMLNRYLRPEQPTMPPPASKYAIAVLPFVNISADPKQEYFCDGISEEIINSLARIKDLRIISRTSSFFFKGKNISTRAIGKQLNVDAVLEGGVRFDGNTMRVTTRLVNVEDDMNLWGATFDRQSKDLFAVQEDISRAIVDRLKIEILPGENLSVQSPENLEAHNHYLKGRFFWEQLAFEKAVSYFEKAINTDPNYALAYSGLSDTYHMMAFFLDDPANTYAAKSTEAALKAFAVGPHIAEALVSLGWVKLNFEWDWQGAEKALKQALELKPNLAAAHRCYAAYLRAMGQYDEAHQASFAALELDPLSPFTNALHSLLLNILGRSDEAIQRLESTLDLYPDHSEVMLFLGLSLISGKKIDQGLRLIEKAGERFEPESPLVQGYLGHAYAISGNHTRARSILRKFLKQRDDGYVSAHAIALIYTGLGETDKAFEWLEKAVQERAPLTHDLKSTISLRPLHADPRWDALLGSIGLK
jgi:adenylate cyclase